MRSSGGNIVPKNLAVRSKSAVEDPAPASSRPATKSRVLAALSCVALAAMLGAAGARAGSCRVLVALGAVDVEPLPAGYSLKISGNWEFDNLMQVATGLSYNVLVVRGDRFVRVHFPDQAWSGTITGLGAEIDAGLDGNDIVAIEANGTAEPGARLVKLEAQRLQLSVPDLPGSGPLSVVAYLVLDGDYLTPIISNTISRTVPDAAATPIPPLATATATAATTEAKP